MNETQVYEVNDKLLAIEGLPGEYGCLYDDTNEFRHITKKIRDEILYLKDQRFVISVKLFHGSRIKIIINKVPENFIIINPWYDQQIHWEFDVRIRDTYDVGKDPRKKYSDHATKLLEYLEKVANQYNKNSTDYNTFETYHNYKFYLSVEFAYEFDIKHNKALIKATKEIMK